MLYHLVLYVFYTYVLFDMFAFGMYLISFTYVSRMIYVYLNAYLLCTDQLCKRLANRFYKRLSRRVEDRVGEMLCFSIYDFCEWFSLHLSRSICPILILCSRYLSSLITLGVCSLDSNCCLLLITFLMI